MTMQIVRSVVVGGPPSAAFALVDDLARYPQWMDLVHEVEAVADADPPAWDVELRARVGPFARSKRLRMQRTQHEPDRRTVFERAEVDGRDHAPWILRVEVEPDTAPDAVEVTMTLTYGGNLWTGAVLQRVLDDHVERGAAALRRLLDA